ncbi:MAG: hydroxymethylbilane synthase [Verrucomicrobiota bacterium]
MKSSTSTIYLATRGSALALAQANTVLRLCHEAFPAFRFEVKVIKTTGDKLQSASLAKPDQALPKGLFTKELEVALLENEADLAIHSLKDLPTELPEGLMLGAVLKRAEVNDVLVLRKDLPLHKSAGGAPLRELPLGATVATSSTRRKAQLLHLRPDLKVVEIRGNVGTRLKKLTENRELAATVLAAAGLERLNFRISLTGALSGEGVPAGIIARRLTIEEMVPCVGQAAIGIEVRAGDAWIAAICERLNHAETFHCVTAERAFLSAMGGGCQSPVAAYAQYVRRKLHLQAVSFKDDRYGRAEGKGAIKDAVKLGEQLAAQLNGDARL